jgi:ketosteroid isomerase-like protein
MTTTESLEAVESAIETLLWEYADAYHRQDVDALLDMHSPAGDAVLIGSTAEERSVGLEEIEAASRSEFARSNPVRLRYSWMSVAVRGPVACVAAECTASAMHDGDRRTVPARLTLVVENGGERWFIVQQHFSQPSL